MIAHCRSLASSPMGTVPTRPGHLRADGTSWGRFNPTLKRAVSVSTSAVSSETSTAQSENKASTASLTGPTPQRFAVAEGQLNDVGSAAIGALVRFGLGAFVLGYSSRLEREDPQASARYTVLSGLPGGFQLLESSSIHKYARPEEPLIIYDKQNCPECRMVREAVSILDLDILFKPCPEGDGTVGWQSELAGKGNSKGHGWAPYMVDPNTGMEVEGGSQIVAYMFRNYGNNRPPLLLAGAGLLGTLLAKLALSPRGNKGAVAAPKSTKPEKPLELWAYEASPFCVLVREALGEVGVAHVQRTCARGSSKRQELFERRGHFQVPYLEDPNTGVAMFESTAIIEYIHKTYGGV